MKKILVLFFCIINGVVSFCQSKDAQIPCIIMIDRTLPHMIDGFISYGDSMKETIYFTYLTGSIFLEMNDIHSLKQLPDSVLITVHISHRKFYKNQRRKDYEYTTNISVMILFSPYGTTIFNITNFNKKKEIYFFDYRSGPLQKKLEIKKEYGNWKKVRKKITSGYS